MQRKVAVITGAGTGVGRSCALMFADQHYSIGVNYSRSETEARKTAEDVMRRGGEALLLKADVSDDLAVRSMMEKVSKSFGRIDVLVNCAGTTDYVPVNDLDSLVDEHWDRAMNVNVKGIFQCSRAAAPYLKKNKGAIINVLSIAANTGVGSSLAYAASKGAAWTLTKGLAKVLAPDIRVNGIAPGLILTRWVSGQEDHVEEQTKDVPLGRAAEPEDVAEMVVMLSEVSYVTGEVVKVDGGRLA